MPPGGRWCRSRTGMLQQRDSPPFKGGPGGRIDIRIREQFQSSPARGRWHAQHDGGGGITAFSESSPSVAFGATVPGRPCPRHGLGLPGAIQPGTPWRGRITECRYSLNVGNVGLAGRAPTPGPSLSGRSVSVPQAGLNGSSVSYCASDGAAAMTQRWRSRKAWRTISACCSSPYLSNAWPGLSA